MMGQSRISDRSPGEIAAAVEEHTEELRAALERHGITLPSLGLDNPPDWNGCPFPLVSLGNCNLETARRLVVVLQAAGSDGAARVC